MNKYTFLVKGNCIPIEFDLIASTMGRAMDKIIEIIMDKYEIKEESEAVRKILMVEIGWDIPVTD